MRKATAFALTMILCTSLSTSLFAYNADARYVDVGTAKEDISSREQEIQQLESDNDALLKKISDNDDYLAERTDKREQVITAITRMNEALADMLKIMSEMTDKQAEAKFKQSIQQNRETRDNLINTRTRLETQMDDTEKTLEKDRLQLVVNRAKIEKLQGEVENLNVQIVRTEEQQKKLDFTIKQAEDALAEIQELVNAIGSTE